MPHRVLGRVGEALSVAGPRVAELTVELPTTVYAEGSTIDATVLATADRDVVVTGGDVELVRNVSYRYRQWGCAGGGGGVGSNPATARHSQVVARSVFHAGGPLPGGQPLVQQVRLLVPSDGPGSVRVELLDISWAVRARLQTKGCRDAKATKHVLVLSEARECAAVAQSAPLVADRGCAVLGFESLSSRRLVGGLPLSGVLTVAPLRPVTARALRLDLVLAATRGTRPVDDRRPCPQPGQRGHGRRDPRCQHGVGRTVRWAPAGQPALAGRVVDPDPLRIERLGGVGTDPHRGATATAIPFPLHRAAPIAGPVGADTGLLAAVDAARCPRPTAGRRPQRHCGDACGDNPPVSRSWRRAGDRVGAVAKSADGAGQGQYEKGHAAG